jgi:hypothetical protein
MSLDNASSLSLDTTALTTTAPELVAGDGWTIFRTRTAHAAALGLARGCYQRGLLAGWEAWSGSTLRGKAAHWGARYARSRGGLLSRMRDAGIPIEWRRDGRRVVAVIG